MVKAERGGKRPSPERVSELVQEAREVADQFGCAVTITASAQNGEVSFALGKEPKPPSETQEHVLFYPDQTPVVLTQEPTKLGEKPKKPVNETVRERDRRRAQNMAVFSGQRGKTVYENGRPVNVRREKPINHKKRSGKRNGTR